MRPPPAVLKARLAEVARRYSKKPRKRVSIAAIRVRDLTHLYRARYGQHLPDDDAGRDDANLMAHHLAALSGNPIKRVEAWISTWAPWMPVGELKELIVEIATRPQRWRADKLAWRLRLTEQDRATLKITTIGAVDMSKAERAKRRAQRNKERVAERRRAKGVKPRAEYLEQVKTEKPWTIAGMSRAAWYRHRHNLR